MSTLPDPRRDPSRSPDVLYVLKRYPRLSETFVVREVLGLEAAGVRVGIDALMPPEPGPRHPEVDEVRADVRYVPRRPRWYDASVVVAHVAVASRAPRRWLRSARAAGRAGQGRRFLQAGIVARRVRRDGYHHVHAHFATAAAETARWAAELSGVTWSVTAHAKDIFHVEHVDALPRRIASAAAVVTVSEHNVDHLSHVAPTVPVRFVPNAVVAADAHGPRSHGTVLCVARLIEKKGIDTLVDAAALLRTDHPDLRVEIVGSGPLRDELTARIAAHGLDEQVVLRGALRSDEVAASYAAAAMLVMPCRIAADGDRDGLPTVILEAMARGLPVVSTDTVGIGEVVRDHDTGLLIAPDDPAALAGAIARLRTDPELGARLGAAGRRLVLDRHAPERCARTLIGVFEEAAA